MARHTELHKEIHKDLNARQGWRESIMRLRRARLGERKKKLLYPHAPNFIEPIIDDNVRSVTSTESQILWSSRYLAHFIPLDEKAQKVKRQAEVAFDTLLRFSIDFRAKVEALLDSKNADGMAIAKMIVNDTAYPRLYRMEGTIPDMDVVDILNLIVPTGTKEIHKSERITEEINLTENSLRSRAKKAGWKNIDEVIERCQKKISMHDAGTGDGRSGTSHVRGAGNDDPSIEMFTIWETYHKINGKRMVTISCPDAADLDIHEFKWEWPTETKVEVSIDPETQEIQIEEEQLPEIERRWPYFQFRFEGRTRDYYDIRGIARLLEDNQKAATQYHNLRGMQFDFFAKPILSGGSSTHGLGKFRWRPGEKLPDGVQVADLPKIDPIFDFSVDLERAAAQRRVGAAQGSLSSVNRGRDRKTATEVNQESFINNLLSTDAVMRFSEPFGEMFNEFWLFLQNFQVPLPMIDTKTMTTKESQEGILDVPFLVRPAASSRNVNPDFALQQLSQLAPYFQNNPFVRQSELTQYVTDQIDPHLTDRLIFDPETDDIDGAPIVPLIQQMQQQIQELTKFVGAHNELLTAQSQEDESREANEEALESLTRQAKSQEGAQAQSAGV